MRLAARQLNRAITNTTAPPRGNTKGAKMSDDATQIRTLIERWTEAVHAGELETVVAGHADDIVMFDVPPPDDGVRGIDA